MVGSMFALVICIIRATGRSGCKSLIRLPIIWVGWLVACAEKNDKTLFLLVEALTPAVVFCRQMRRFF